MSNKAWCDLNKKGDHLKVHDMCPNLYFKCQKQITVTPRQIQLDGNGFKSQLQKISKGTKTA